MIKCGVSIWKISGSDLGQFFPQYVDGALRTIKCEDIRHFVFNVTLYYLLNNFLLYGCQVAKNYCHASNSWFKDFKRKMLAFEKNMGRIFRPKHSSVFWGVTNNVKGNGYLLSVGSPLKIRSVVNLWTKAPKLRKTGQTHAHGHDFP